MEIIKSFIIFFLCMNTIKIINFWIRSLNHSIAKQNFEGDVNIEGTAVCLFVALLYYL